MSEEGRSLYQCLNAKYPIKGKRLRCSKGHDLSLNASVLALGRGRPLVIKRCQNCLDYDEMGPPVPPDERGWLKDILNINK